MNATAWTRRHQLQGAITEITGRGTMNMASGALDYQLNLALSNALLDKMRGVRCGRVQGSRRRLWRYRLQGVRHDRRAQNDLAAAWGRRR